MRRRVGVSHRGCPLATESERRRRGPRDAPDVRGRARDGRAMASRKPPRTRARGLSLARDIRVRGRRRVTLATPAQRRGPARRFGQGGRARDGDSRGGRARARRARVRALLFSRRRASAASVRNVLSGVARLRDERCSPRASFVASFDLLTAEGVAGGSFRVAIRRDERAREIGRRGFFHKISLGGGFLARPPVEALAHVDDGSGEIQVLFTPRFRPNDPFARRPRRTRAPSASERSRSPPRTDVR